MIRDLGSRFTIVANLWPRIDIAPNQHRSCIPLISRSIESNEERGVLALTDLDWASPDLNTKTPTPPTPDEH